MICHITFLTYLHTTRKIPVNSNTYLPKHYYTVEKLFLAIIDS